MFPPILQRPLILTRQQRRPRLPDKQIDFFFISVAVVVDWGLSPMHFPVQIKIKRAAGDASEGCGVVVAVRLAPPCGEHPADNPDDHNCCHSYLIIHKSSLINQWQMISKNSLRH